MSARTYTVAPAEAGTSILDWLQARLHLSRGAAGGLLTGRKVRLNGAPCSNPGWRLRAGQRVEVVVAPGRPQPLRREAPRPLPSKQPAAATIVLRHVDEQIVVVDKPAGVTTMRHADEAAEFGKRGQRYLPATLADQLPARLAARGGKPGRVIAVHRLDRDTSGLVVFARTPEAERHLGQQFRAHSVERLYFALVRGQARDARLESVLLPDRGDGRRGSARTPEEKGQRAVTHVRLVEALGDYSLVECRLETGRTHQVRIHLGEAGTPLCGERIYDRPTHGRPYPDGSAIGRIALHAATLGLTHPVSGERLNWSSALPRDMASLLDRLRRQTEGGA